MEAVEERTAPSEEKKGTIKVTVCLSLSGLAEGGMEVFKEFEKQIEEHGASAELQERGGCTLGQVGCRGYCSRDVLVDVYVPGQPRVTYERVKPENVAQIMKDHILGGKVFTRLAAKQDYYDTLEKQARVAFAHGGSVDPERIEDYIEVGGYEALRKVLTSMTPEQVIEEIKKSGLRGKGGGGFVTGVKWEKCRAQPGDRKFIMVNGDEGNPASYMDRSVMEGCPHQIIEGMLIGAYAIGGTDGIIYTRSDYSLAVKRLNKALADLRERGWLGENIMGSGFNFDIYVHEGMEAFIGGESTALMSSVEGKRPFPKAQPPHSVEKGVFGYPTNLNNAETWATVPKIIQNGADWYASMGPENARGAKSWAIAGNVKYNGIMELDMNTTLGEIVDDYCGGILKKKQLKVMHVGGVGGGLLSPECKDVKTDYESLKQAGANMGQASFAAYDQTACVIDLARFSIGFNESETCGKCTPCRIGMTLVRNMLDDIAEGRGTLEHIDKLEAICQEIQVASLCGLGETAPNMVLTGIRYFRKEYERHIVDQICDAARCTGLYRYVVKEDECVACGACIKPCPTGAITGGTKKVPAHIDMDLCINCNACYQACNFLAIL